GADQCRNAPLAGRPGRDRPRPQGRRPARPRHRRPGDGRSEAQGWIPGVKNVLVTGAAKRLGRAIALDLAATGWNVAIHAKESYAEAKSVAEEIHNRGLKTALIHADLRTEGATANLVSSAAEAIGPLTALI